MPRGKQNKPAQVEEGHTAVEAVEEEAVEEASTALPSAMVTLLKGHQIVDRDTGVTLRLNQAVPVPKVGKWLKDQEGYGLVRIQPLK